MDHLIMDSVQYVDDDDIDNVVDDEFEELEDQNEEDEFERYISSKNFETDENDDIEQDEGNSPAQLTDAEKTKSEEEGNHNSNGSSNNDGEVKDEGPESPDEMQGGYDGNTTALPAQPRSITDEEFRMHEEELVHEDAYEIRYFKTPLIDPSKVIVTYKELSDLHKREVLSSYDNLHNETDMGFEYAREVFKMLDIENKPVVNYLVKEFEMRKRASEYKRSSTANSGIINLTNICLLYTSPSPRD